MSQNNKEIKIFPRNLTAKADYVVKGNPVSTRLESGVDNCYPGLEFDQRNLDKAFFPGLFFDFHRSDGAILDQIVEGFPPAQLGLNYQDKPLYLWTVIGRNTPGQDVEDPIMFHLYGLNGLEVWRRIHNLLECRISVLVGPEPGFSASYPMSIEQDLLNSHLETRESVIQRDEQGKIIYAIFVGVRARYLDENGVIDSEVYKPGELTKTLCAPWQYDFRDCGCFYWASNKPDLVTSNDGEHNHLNFMRKDRTSNPPPTDTPNYQDRRRQELNYAEMMTGWNDLPIVVNDRECEKYSPPNPVHSELMTRQEVIEELKYLATVEHALCVQYLYAHYSLNAPMEIDKDASSKTKKIFAAANQVLSIAIDEMRHLRWANEALHILGESPSINRAEIIGKAFNKPFELKSLTREQLQWFINVEKPSQDIEKTIDGMYVKLHSSIDKQPNLFPEKERIVHLMKLIIDEGEDHYQRFLSIEKHLEDIEESDYLRPLNHPVPGSNLEHIQKLTNNYYKTVFKTLEIAFSLGDKSGGRILEQSRREMHNLHETAHYLATNNIKTPFEFFSPPFPPTFSTVASLNELNSLSGEINSNYSKIISSDKFLKEKLVKQQEINEKMFASITSIIRGNEK